MNNMLNMNLRHLRYKHKFSQEELAEKLDVSRQTIAKWENGESMPDPMKCAELAHIYNVTIDELIMASLDEMGDDDEDSDENNYVFGIVKVGERGQVVIPKQARKTYNISAGDKLLVVGDNRGMAFAKVKGLSTFDFGR